MDARITITAGRHPIKVTVTDRYGHWADSAHGCEQSVMTTEVDTHVIEPNRWRDYRITSTRSVAFEEIVPNPCSNGAD